MIITKPLPKPKNKPFASTKLTSWSEIRELFGLLAYGRIMINASQHVFVRGYRNSTGNFDFPAPNKCAPLVFNSLKLKRSCPSRPQRWVAVAPHSLPRSLRNNSRHIRLGVLISALGCWRARANQSFVNNLRPLAPKNFTRNTITILSSFDEHRAQARFQEKSNHTICLCNRNNKCRSH